MDAITPADPKLISDDARDRMLRILRDRLGGPGEWSSLSHGQQALWFLWRLAPDNHAFNIVFPVGIRGALDTGALKAALRRLSNRHPGLRMEFADEDGEVFQRARPRGDVNLQEVDASGLDDAELQAAVRDAAQTPFDLEADATLRAVLFRRSAQSHVLLLALPHIVSDLWSFIVLMDDLRALYAAETSGEAADLAPLPAFYEDYVIAQQRLLDSPRGEALWAYWKSELEGELPVLDLPADHIRPPARSFRGASLESELDADLVRDLKALAAREDATLYMVLLAAFQVLLHRHSGQDCVIVGAPTSGRRQGQFGDLVGDFVNMVPLRADLDGAPAFRTALKAARQRVIGAIEHQDFPFSLMVDRLEPERDLSRSPIFQASIVLQQFHRYPELSRAMLPGPNDGDIPFADLTLEPWRLPQQEGQLDIALEAKEDGAGRLRIAWKYAADIFAPDTIARMAAQYGTLLREIAADPARPIDELPLLDAAERAQVLKDAQGPMAELPDGASVHELFAAQAELRGDASALTCGDDTLSYRALAERVDAMARGLAAEGAGPDVVVALLLPRGFDFVAAMLAVCKAGGAFLPLDPRHPLQRAAQTFASGGISMVLTDAAKAGEVEAAVAELAEGERPHIAVLEALDPDAAEPDWPVIDPDGLAYMMYTSGSTGAPKGVMVEHRGMINHAMAKLGDLGMGAGDALAQNAPQSFDVVVWQSLAPLTNGGRVAIMTDAVAEDCGAMLAEIEARGVSVLQVVPSMMRALIEEIGARDAPPPLTPLRWMVPTGEALPVELCQRWLALYPHIPILNTYGSTECSDDQCHYVIDAVAGADAIDPIASIGTPIQNMAAYVLDANLEPVPVGVVGEIYIGGIGVGRGYRGDPERTESVFLPDPFSDRPGARIYKARDLGRRRRDGSLSFIGRTDHMIKLRGLRIEPGEIEAALRSHPRISEAAVLARPHPSGEKRLVAYVVCTQPPDDEAAQADAIRRHLGGRLPQYMTPSAYCFLDAMPLTANGKLDQRRLPAPEWHAEAEAGYVAPRGETEEKLAAIWATALKQERVSVEADFFAVGGDSILSIQIASRCRAAGLAVQPSAIFLHRTIAELAAQLESAEAEAADESFDAALAFTPIGADALARAAAQVSFGDAE